MAAVIQFETSKFDFSSEPGNDINPILGQTILLWIMQCCPNINYIAEPKTEDWGWYIKAEINERRYVIGASAGMEESNKAFCTVLINKNRTVREQLLGKEKLQIDDSLVSQISELFLKNSDFMSVDLSFE